MLRWRALRRALFGVVSAEFASLASAEARLVCTGVDEAWKALFTRVASPCKSDASPLGMTRTRMLFDAQRMRTASARWALNALAQNGLASLLRHAPPPGLHGRNNEGPWLTGQTQLFSRSSTSCSQNESCRGLGLSLIHI